jgi:hypothetical protein
MRQLALQLKEKYGLAHVPGPGKTGRWCEFTRRRIEEGAPPEEAGIEAARRVFTYEFKSHGVYAGTPVEQLLSSCS